MLSRLLGWKKLETLPEEPLTKEVSIQPDKVDVSLGIIETITAGALANILCMETETAPNFIGGIVANSLEHTNNMLNIDMDFVRKTNYANPFTTLDLAKQACDKFTARIGMATTGHIYLKDSKIKNPYVIVCIYDSKTGYHSIKTFDYVYNKSLNKNMQISNIQNLSSLEAKNIYVDYINKLTGISPYIDLPDIHHEEEKQATTTNTTTNTTTATNTATTIPTSMATNGVSCSTKQNDEKKIVESINNIERFNINNQSLKQSTMVSNNIQSNIPIVLHRRVGALSYQLGKIDDTPTLNASREVKNLTNLPIKTTNNNRINHTPLSPNNNTDVQPSIIMFDMF